MSYVSVPLDGHVTALKFLPVFSQLCAGIRRSLANQTLGWVKGGGKWGVDGCREKRSTRGVRGTCEDD